MPSSNKIDGPLTRSVGLFPHEQVCPRLPSAGCSGLSAPAPGNAEERVLSKDIRQDLTPQDRQRVNAVTRPTSDFSKAEPFEAMSAGAATSTSAPTLDAFLASSRPISPSDNRKSSSSAMRCLANSGSRPRPRPRLPMVWAALQCAILPELPCQGWTRPSARGWCGQHLHVFAAGTPCRNA